MSLILDHIAIAAGTLAEGVDFVEAALGLPLAGGGQHVVHVERNDRRAHRQGVVGILSAAAPDIEEDLALQKGLRRRRIGLCRVEKDRVIALFEAFS